VSPRLSRSGPIGLRAGGCRARRISDASSTLRGMSAPMRARISPRSLRGAPFPAAVHVDVAAVTGVSLGKDRISREGMRFAAQPIPSSRGPSPFSPSRTNPSRSDRHIRCREPIVPNCEALILSSGAINPRCEAFISARHPFLCCCGAHAHGVTGSSPREIHPLLLWNHPVPEQGVPLRERPPSPALWPGHLPRGPPLLRCEPLIWTIKPASRARGLLLSRSKPSSRAR